MRTGQDAVLGGRYRLVSAIAVGGMGQVWRGLDELLGRVVAVKVLKPELASDPGFLDRFRTEARHSAGLSHPTIATVYDYGEAGGSAYLVMELVPGEPLSDLLAREGALPVRRAAALVAAAAHGLAAAHRAGLVHRDVKPGNLIVTPDGGVKITDFGIARAAAEAPITATGEVMGTAAYFAPEQAVGRRDITPAADLYALGVVLFECLAGYRPFTGDSQVAIALAHVNDPPPPLPPSVTASSRAVAALTAALLTKEPAERPDEASAVAAVAEAVAAGDEGLALERLAAAVPGRGPAGGARSADPTVRAGARGGTTGAHAAPRTALAAGATAVAPAAGGPSTGGADPWTAAGGQPLRGAGVDDRDPPRTGGRHATAGAAAGGGQRSRLTVPALGLLAVAGLLALVAVLTGLLDRDGGSSPAPAPPATSAPATTTEPPAPSTTEPTTPAEPEPSEEEPSEEEPAPPEESPEPEPTAEPTETAPTEPTEPAPPTSSSTSAPTSSSTAPSSPSAPSSGSPTSSSGASTSPASAPASSPGPSVAAPLSKPLPAASAELPEAVAATVDPDRSEAEDAEDGTG